MDRPAVQARDVEQIADQAVETGRFFARGL
jgi:hypothetical protein